MVIHNLNFDLIYDHDNNVTYFVSNSRMYRFCSTYQPGQWVSICLRLKLTNQSQEMTLVQDGQICFHKQYSNPGFEWFYYKQNASVVDM